MIADEMRRSFSRSSSRGERLVDPGMPSEADLELAHTKDWVRRTLKGELGLADETRMELPCSPELVVAHAKQAAGTYLACREALETGLGLHIGGGSHHAFADHGEGFCIFNDLAAALIKLRKEGVLESAAVVDLDVHQGNGTASILDKEPALFTLSLHQGGIYPFAGPSPTDCAGTADVALPAGMGDGKYLKLLSARLEGFLDERRPGLVLYQAGVDCWEGDLLGSLSLTREGLAARDRMVFEACLKRGIPAAVALGGGYAERLEDTVALHVQTLNTALELQRSPHRG
ncbi:MAG: histone deacetylase [Elusimicrobiota bacterium]